MELRERENGDKYIVSDTGRHYEIYILQGTSGKTCADIYTLMYFPSEKEEAADENVGLKTGIVYWSWGIPNFDSVSSLCDCVDGWRKAITEFERNNFNVEGKEGFGDAVIHKF